ncbi:MAG: pseudouridine synthase [Chitinophagaceae bacterium]
MSKNAQFEKFINKKKGSVLKEKLKQDKKAFKKERAIAIEKRFEEKRQFREKGTRPETPPPPAPRTSRSSAVASRSVKSTAVKPSIGGLPKAATPPESAPSKGVIPSKAVSSNGKTTSKIDAKGPTGAKGKPVPVEPTDLMPLNKYIAHSGICSRRDAAELVKKGGVNVNGTAATDPGMKVSVNDVIKVNGKKIVPSQSFVYILLNKPKDYITTTDDPQGRKTVLELIRNATDQRVYPIGRLDRNTSGVLLFTNDGDLAQTLSHPKHEIKKIYEVRLDKEFTRADFETLTKGVLLEDGFIAPDVLAYADSADKSVIGVEIHSGRNRIVRRIFEKLGYDVRGLDRVMYAGLTKKNVQRGKYRHLTEREIRILKHFNKDTKLNKHA